MWWTVVKEAAGNWSSHKDARQGAALAYYSVFSLGPIIVIAIAVAGLFFGHDAVTSQVMSSIKDMLGDTGAKAVEAMLAGASRPAAGALATFLGIGALLFAAIGVVVQLKDALNVVWEVEKSKEFRALALRSQLRAFVCGGVDARLLTAGLVVGERRPCCGGQICRYLSTRRFASCRQHADFVRGRASAIRHDV
jgi:uncharacterized BrkB/YihY/UPF0761 family membrane protein